MTKEKTEVKKTVAKIQKSTGQDWHFPKLGVTVRATSLEEAMKKLNKPTDK